MNLENTLRLQRFCGHEVYAVQKGEVYVDLPGEGKQGVVLNLEFHAGGLIECTTPEDERGEEPTVEVNLPIPSLAASDLVGKTIRVKKALDPTRDTWNRIYVFEHEDLREIAATFIEATKEECRLSLTARTQDPNHYDGSKPETIVKLEGWFPLAKLDEAAKSMAPPPGSVRPASLKPVAAKPATVPPAAPDPEPTKPAAKQTTPESDAPERTAKSAAQKPTRASKQVASTKAPSEKAAGKNAFGKKAPAKKGPATPTSKPAPKKATLKKATQNARTKPARKPAKKTTAKKTTAKKTTAKKTTAKKTTAKKGAAETSRKKPARKA